MGCTISWKRISPSGSTWMSQFLPLRSWKWHSWGPSQRVLSRLPSERPGASIKLVSFAPTEVRLTGIPQMTYRAILSPRLDFSHHPSWQILPSSPEHVSPTHISRTKAGLLDLVVRAYVAPTDDLRMHYSERCFDSLSLRFSLVRVLPHAMHRFWHSQEIMRWFMCTGPTIRVVLGPKTPGSYRPMLLPHHLALYLRYVCYQLGSACG